MEKMRLKMIAFPGAGEEVFKQGQNQLLKAGLSNLLLPANEQPDILFVLSGGSEHESKQSLKNSDGVAILAGDFDNSFAAAMEIKAWCNQHAIASFLINLADPELKEKLDGFMKAKKAMQHLHGQKLGLIGRPSAWLIASQVEQAVIEQKLGINLRFYPWDELPHFNNYEPNAGYLKKFGANHTADARVFSMLNDLITREKLDAITIECFPMVNRDGVTACLSLSMLNDAGIQAGCEGDLSAIAGMMVAHAITGASAWIANIASISPADNKILLAHCTIATSLVDRFEVTTHFESGKGTAIKGVFSANEATLFRFSNDLSQAFITTGTVVSRPESSHACRTQVELLLNDADRELLMDKPLGNHHLLVAGDIRQALAFFCNFKSIKIVS